MSNVKTTSQKSNVRCETNAFTLIELLISITIFMIFIGIVGGSYITLVSANRNANETQKMYREVRSVFDTFASEIRNGMIDYSCIDPELDNADARCLEGLNATTRKTLRVLAKSGRARTFFEFRDGKILATYESREGANKPWIATSAIQPLVSEQFPVADFGMTVFPAKDPYLSRNAALDDVQYQPSVSIKMKIKGYEFQTTYSSRNYGR